MSKNPMDCLDRGKSCLNGADNNRENNINIKCVLSFFFCEIDNIWTFNVILRTQTTLPSPLIHRCFVSFLFGSYFLIQTSCIIYDHLGGRIFHLVNQLSRASWKTNETSLIQPLVYIDWTYNTALAMHCRGWFYMVGYLFI